MVRVDEEPDMEPPENDEVEPPEDDEVEPPEDDEVEISEPSGSSDAEPEAVALDVSFFPTRQDEMDYVAAARREHGPEIEHAWPEIFYQCPKHPSMI